MSNEKEVAELRQFCEDNDSKVDIVMTILHMAGFDGRVIDYISNGAWSKKQAIIGLDMSEIYPVRKWE